MDNIDSKSSESPGCPLNVTQFRDDVPVSEKRKQFIRLNATEPFIYSVSDPRPRLRPSNNIEQRFENDPIVAYPTLPSNALPLLSEIKENF